MSLYLSPSQISSGADINLVHRDDHTVSQTSEFESDVVKRNYSGIIILKYNKLIHSST